MLLYTFFIYSFSFFQNIDRRIHTGMFVLIMPVLSFYARIRCISCWIQNICLLLSDIFHVLPAYIQAWQNRSPEIFSPVFSPLFGFHSRTTGWQNISRMVPCSQSLISASIPPGSYGGVLFLPAASLAASGTCPADRYFHLPYSLHRISANVFLIYNAEIPLPVPGKISGKPLPDLAVHSPAQENPPLSAMDILFYIRPACFSASFFLPDNNGSYPQASGYRESGCSRLQTVDKLGAGHNPQHQVCLQPEIPAFISWYFFIVKDSEIKR